MSAAGNPAHDNGHGNAHDGAHGHHDAKGGGDGHGAITVRGYVTGFVLSVVLTAIPFWLVMGHAISQQWLLVLALLGLGSVQIVVHMVYFLHMNARSEAGWNLLALIFTMVLVVIALVGSLWVMYHLNENMMPMSPQQVRNLP
jgi:cytochrome o ubiquinol oxidase operon protein cyoD